MKKLPKDIILMKSKEKITVLTAYDFCTAKNLDEAGIDVILVGDSLGMVVLGYNNTLSVTMDDMLRHTGAVVRGVKNALIVSDLPTGSYEDNETAALNAESLIKTGADAVKIENKPKIAKFLVENKFEVMGHVGLTPQTVLDFKVQGKDDIAARNILEMAKELEQAGCFAVVLEGIPLKLGKKITEELSIPTIGIGAGPHCDGQVLVVNDLLGIYDKFSPKFVKKYANLGEDMKRAFSEYISDVKGNRFPEDQHSFH
jgi:3-methyl-2-oxobutanoate hydroxymethyltransferase